MPEFLTELVKADIKLDDFKNDNEIIQQGLGPLLALSKQSILLHKNNLLEQLKLQNWQNKARILFNKLNKQQINFLVFKGFAFTYLLYNNSNLRPYSDIDIIIDKKDYAVVSNLLIQLGYQQYPSRQGEFVSFQNSFFDNDSPQTIIDLHWQINNRIEFHQHFPFCELYVRAIELDTKQFTFKSLGLVDAFILGCFHYQAHRPKDRKHIWLYDLALIWRQMDSNIQKACLEKAKKSNQSSIVTSSLSLLQNTFINYFDFDCSIPHQQNEATGYYLHKRTNKLYDIITRIQNIDGIQNKAKFVTEYVFQSRKYVRNRYRLKSNMWLFFYYPRMWLEDVVKLFKSS